MPIRAVLFDMGNTLIEFETRPFDELHTRGLAAAHRLLAAAGGAGRFADFRARFDTSWAALEAAAAAAGGQVDLAAALRGALAVADESLVDAMVAAHYEIVRAQVHPYPDALAVLEACRSRGLATALVSNTIWPAAFHRADLERFGLAPWLDAAVFSSELGVAKPRPEIFHEALDALGVAPGEAVVVGDRLSADVAGARAAGCRAVLRRHRFTYPEGPRAVEPDAEIDALAALLPLLDRW